ncbi:TPA: helix-turn-helix transcriptional regulator [Streptococcus suis]|nr:helix-turn-helix transcriptional regulator [Streptococcus suis]HEL2701531.1 helix-turn-helix transcriptional regulator [Streptococcus suis]
MNKLKLIRKKAGVSQVKLSKETDIPLRTIQHWELGNTIKPEKAKILADYFKVPVSTLLGYAENDKTRLIVEDSNYINVSGRLKLTNVTTSDVIREFEKGILETPLNEFEQTIYNSPAAKLTEFYKLLSSLTPPFDNLVAKFAILPVQDQRELNDFANYLVRKNKLNN